MRNWHWRTMAVDIEKIRWSWQWVSDSDFSGTSIEFQCKRLSANTVKLYFRNKRLSLHFVARYERECFFDDQQERDTIQFSEIGKEYFALYSLASVSFLQGNSTCHLSFNWNWQTLPCITMHIMGMERSRGPGWMALLEVPPLKILWWK